MLVSAEVDSEAVVDMEHLAGMVRLDNVEVVEDVAVEEGAEALRSTQSALSEKMMGITYVCSTS
jgi:hypothetical protein